MQQPNAHTERCLKSLRSKLRRVPAICRNAHHQMATRYVMRGLQILPANESAALQYLNEANHHAAHFIPTLSTERN